VAKHGGRSVSSSSGSADVLEALGANIMLTPAQVASAWRPRPASASCSRPTTTAMKNVAPIRREMGVRTIFNILGPLTNPASAPNTLLGVFHPDLVGILVRVMQRLGAEHVLVVHGKDGMDEISLGAATMVGELKDGEISEYEIHPEDFGLQMHLRVGSAEESKAMLLGVLENKANAAREVVCLNAGAALYVANLADSIGDGIAKAREAIASGAARAKLDAFVEFTKTHTKQPA
jgi:anthranilate phosphoribosyltransferase